MDVRDCIIAADAMSCQMSFVNGVLAGGADYCLAVKGNQDKSFKELRSLFMTTHDDQIEVHCGEVELDHGRIEKRTVSLIDGHLLSAPLRQKWQGLEHGCIVRIRSQRTFKSSGHTETDERFYISSLPADERSAQRLGEISRVHWSVENRLHWVLDMHFDQDKSIPTIFPTALPSTSWRWPCWKITATGCGSAEKRAIFSQSRPRCAIAITLTMHLTASPGLRALYKP